MANKALIVAIADYHSKPLPGANHDFVQWSGLVSSAPFSFSIHALHNATATRDAIEREFKALLAGAAASDSLLAYFSCHGTRLSVGRTTNDGLVAYSASATTAADIVFDFELHRWIREASLPAGARLTLITDCCFADGISQLENMAMASRQDAVVTRFLPVMVPANDDVMRRAEKASRMEERIRAFDAASVPEPLFLAATQKEASAYESVGPLPRGLFSSALADVVTADPHVTHKAAMTAVDRIVAAVRADQHPTIRGPRKRNSFLQ